MDHKKFRIIIKEKDCTDDVLDWREGAGKIHITYTNGYTYSYNKYNVQIEESALSDEDALKCFQYFKKIAESVGLHDPRAGNILLNHFKRINFVPKDNMLAAFLTGKLPDFKPGEFDPPIYPFGFNLSQKVAVDNTLDNLLSIIEGPPGTGKTQTILNIIANAVMRGETVAVVSANNSATANVLEKLQKYQVGFIAALLGNTENKQNFIKSENILPDLSEWEISDEQESKIKSSIKKLYSLLKDMLAKQNELAVLSRQLDNIEFEQHHFLKANNVDIDPSTYINCKNSDKILELCGICESYLEQKRRPNFFNRMINRFLYGVKDKSFYSLEPEAMIVVCQKHWYIIKINEFKQIVLPIQSELDRFDFSEKMTEYTSLSTEIFKNALAKKYKDFSDTDQDIQKLWLNTDEFVKRFPVILSTTYSVRTSVPGKTMYDYVIIDEASQVDLATGVLAFSCAKKAVVVGDLKQLPNVVDSETARKTDAIFKEFDLPNVYRYKDNSLLSSVSKLFPDAPKTLLREHYRCHPKIIEFCNRKFYDGQLIVLTELDSRRKPLIVYKTKPGNHARSHVNQRQIDVIQNEIIPEQKLDIDGLSVGVVTPYRNQTNALQKAFASTGIQADTVDKFQGRENDIIILSTVDNQISDFADNANRLNVAVSRAKEQLIVVMNGGDEIRDTNIGDLVRYIEYNNLDVFQSEIGSVFDYLYKNYREQRNKLLQRRGRVSEYDSENLMHILIRDVISKESFDRFDVATHVPLKMIIRDMKKLTPKEKDYANNPLTHVDFLIFDKLGKTPRLAIEVDGVSFHAEGTKQADRDKIKNKIFEKYNLPFIRFKTTGSAERETLVSTLNKIIGIKK